MKRFQELVKSALCFVLAACMVVSMLLSDVGAITSYAAEGTEYSTSEMALETGGKAVSNIVNAAGNTVSEFDGEGLDAPSAPFDQEAEVYIDENQMIWVHVQAPAGVFPDGAYLDARYVGTEDSDDEEAQAALDAVEEARIEEGEEGEKNTLSYVLDIKVYDAEGNELQPNSEYGEVSVRFEMANVSGIAAGFEEDAKAGMVEKISEALGVGEEEAAELAEGLDLSVAKEDVAFDVYHIAEEEETITAEKLDSEEVVDENSTAESVIEVVAESFSDYIISFYEGNNINAQEPEVKYYIFSEGDTTVAMSEVLGALGITATPQSITREGTDAPSISDGNVTVKPGTGFKALKLDFTGGHPTTYIFFKADATASEADTYTIDITVEAEDDVVTAEFWDLEDWPSKLVEKYKDELTEKFTTDYYYSLLVANRFSFSSNMNYDPTTTEISLNVGETGTCTLTDPEDGTKFVVNVTAAKTKYSYEIKGYPNGYQEGTEPTYTASLATILQAVLPDLDASKMVGLAAESGDVSVDGSNVTVAGPNKSGVIVFYDEADDNRKYEIEITSDQISLESEYNRANFEVILNDNTGDVTKDVTNKGNRPEPTDELIDGNYDLYFAVGDGEMKEWTFANFAEALGLSEADAKAKGLLKIFKEYTLSNLIDTTTNVTRWNFKFEATDEADNKLPKMIVVDGEEKQLSFTVVQKEAFENYCDPTNDGVIVMGGSILNTVETLYEADVVFVDNENAYNTRPVDLLDSVKIFRYRSDENMSKAEEVENPAAYLVSEQDADGNYVWKLNGLPNYAEDGTGLNYFIQVDIEVNPAVATATSEYLNTYENDDIYSTNTTGLFTGGTLEAILDDSLPFYYDKTWTDPVGSERPSPSLHLYSILEDELLAAEEAGTVVDPNHFSPVDDTRATKVPNENDEYLDQLLSTGAAYYIFPLYDDMGRKIIYFAFETGLEGGYMANVDNTRALNLSNRVLGDKWYPNTATNAKVISQLNKITNTYYGSGTYTFPKYVINGGAIDNWLEEPVTVVADVILEATAMASMDAAVAHLELQKWDPEAGKWVPVTNGDLVDSKAGVPMDQPIETDVVFSDSERLADTVASDPVPKYDEDGNLINYRWKETTISLNNGEDKTIIWIAEDETEPGETKPGVAYSSEFMNMGDLAPGVNGEPTSVYLDADMSAETLTGSQWYSEIVNAIKADQYVEIIKTWSTSEGENVTQAVGEAGGSATFKITRDDGKRSVTPGETPGDDALYDKNGEVVYDVVLDNDDLAQNGTAWIERLIDLNRFDAGGHEYLYSAIETGINPGSYSIQNWTTYITYRNSVVDGPDNTKVKQTDAIVANTEGPEGELWLSAEKRWLDGGDISTRKDVYAALYRINADGTAFLIDDTLLLNEEDNWYDARWISASTVYKYAISADGKYTENKEGATIGALKAEDQNPAQDFVIVEIGTSKTDEALMAKYGEHTYLELTPAELTAIRNKVAGTGETRTEKDVIMTLADNESDPTGESVYSYNVFGEFGTVTQPQPSQAGYTWTNQRVATVDVSMEKAWADGGARREGKFELIRMDYTGENEVVLFDADDGFILGGNNPETDAKPVAVADPEGRSFTYQRTDDGKTSKIYFDGLPKYDYNGDQYTYRLIETHMWDEGLNKWVEIENGGILISAGDRYGVTMAHQETVVPDFYLHHDNRREEWKASNSLVGSYDLNFFKVWYDDGSKAKNTFRPQIYFDIFAVSDSAVIDEDNNTVRDYIDEIYKDNSNVTYEDFMNRLGLYVAGKQPYKTISEDRIWTTDGNQWAWECEIGTVPQYDSNGNELVYFAKENNIAASEYKTININNFDSVKSTDLSATVTSPKGALDVAEEIEAEERDYFVLLSDGELHGQNVADPGKVFTRTVVNYRENKRTISGRKVWKMPAGISIPDDNMPEVKFSLYRALAPLTNGITPEELAKYYNEHVQDWITRENATKVLEVKLHTKDANVDGKGVFNFPTYTYKVTQEVYGDNQDPLPKYNTYGQTYYYYVVEDTEVAGYPVVTGVEYNTADFYVTNAYNIEKEYAEVGVEKDWDITAALKNGLTLKELAPVTISLYAQAFEQDDPTVAAGEPVLFATQTVDPTTVDDGVIQFVFRTITNKDLDSTIVGKELPYIAPTGGIYKYFVVENEVDGYDQYLKIGSKSVESAIENEEYIALTETRTNEDGELIHTNIGKDSDIAVFTNVYEGDKKDFEAIKYWEDEYVDNDKYRPDTITLTIMRKSENGVDTKYSTTAVLKKSDNPKSNKWSVVLEDLVKFDPLGAEYTYYVAKESSGNFTAEKVGDKINDYYVLKSINEDGSITNKLENEHSLSIKKAWTYTDNGQELNLSSWTTFQRLRAMNALPTDLKYVVLRRVAGGTWETIDASTVEDAEHTVSYNNKDVLGYDLDLSKITAATFYTMFNGSYSWKHLPSKDANGKVYEYNMKEVATWITTEAPGTKVIEYVDGTKDNGMESSFGVTTKDEATAIAAKNKIETQKVRLAKEWKDDKGYDNTRPASLEVTLTSKATGESFKYTLTTKGNSDSVYMSDYFYLPNISVVELNSTNYDISEKFSEKTAQGTTPAEYEYKWLDENNKIIYSAKDDAYYLNLSNTLKKTDRKTIDLAATKKWAGENEFWGDTLRPTVEFTLQYYDRTTQKWVDMTAATIGNFYDPADTTITADKPAPVASQTVTFDTADLKKINSSKTVHWYHLYKYWKDNSVDGTPELIKYRVKETLTPDNGNYGANNTSGTLTYSMTDAKMSYTGTITNTLKSTPFVVKKTWNSGSLSKAQIQTRINLDALPQTMEMLLEYTSAANPTDDDWKVYPFVLQDGQSEGHFVFNSYNDYAGLTVQGKLPRYDATGNTYKYRVTELSVKYKSGDIQSRSGNVIGNFTVTDGAVLSWDGSTNPTFSVKNEYEYGTLNIKKIWKDEANREGREATITVKVTGVNVNYSSTTTLSANNWSASYSQLPKWNHDKSALATYTVEEIKLGSTNASSGKVGEYTISYDPETASGTFESGTSITINAINTYVPQRGTVNATKEWLGDDLWKELTRTGSVEVTLQYKLGSGNWTAISQKALDADGLYPDNGVYTTSAAKQTIIINADGTASTVAWENLPVYYNKNTTDKVQYRVVETKVDNYSISYEGNGVTLADKETKSAKVKNTLDTTDIMVYKNWKNNSQDSALTKTQLQELINLDALPVSLEMAVEYSTDGTTWTTVPTQLEDGKDAGHFTFNTLNDYAGKEVAAKLPKSTATGVAIKYRVIELSATYASGTVTRNNTTIGNLTVTDSDPATWTDPATKPSFTLTNTYESGEIKVQKAWNDENNRDQLRDAITVKLTGVNVNKTLEAVLTGNLTSNTGLSYTWKNIPSKDHNGNPATYKVEEIKIGNTVVTDGKAGEYTVSYSPQSGVMSGGKLTLNINNRHNPAKGSITAEKEWDVPEYWYKQVVPDSVTVKLQYKNAQGVWTDITKQDTVPYTNEGIYTTSNPKQTIEYFSSTENWNYAQWNNLPVYFDNEQTKVQYRVVEDSVDGFTIKYSFTADGVELVKDASEPVETTVTNTMDSTTLSIHKDWALNGADEELVLPDSITFKVEYGVEDEDGAVATWKALSNYNYTEVVAGEKTEVTGKTDDYGKVTINKPTEDILKWTEVLFEGLAKVDADGNNYSYRVSEVEVTFGTKTVTVSGQFAEDGTTYIINSAGSFGNTDSKVETASDDGGFAATAVNSLSVGNVSAEKIWDDEDNRDNSRLSSIAFQLYRDGAAYGTAVTLTAGTDGKWADEIKHTWNNVPLYRDDATSHTDAYKSVYTVKETATWKDGQTYTTYYSVGTGDKNTDYTKATVNAAADADDAQITVTNHYEPKLGKVNASKLWNDVENYYNTRPGTIYFKLQYRVDGTDTWADVVKKDNKNYPDDGVYTTSAIVQEIDVAAKTAEQKKVAVWENVPYFTNEGTAVYYRVVETDEDGNILTSPAYDNYMVSYSYDVNGETFTEEVSELNQTVTNTMQENSLELTKVWEGDDTWKQLVRPQSVTFLVEYKIKGSTDEFEAFNSKDGQIKMGQITVKADGNWSAKVEKIPFNYEIRVSEAYITFDGNKVYADEGSFTTKDNGSTWTPDGKVGAYTAKVDVSYNVEKALWTAAAKNTLETGEIDVQKEWIDANNRDGFRDEIKVKLHRNESVLGKTSDKVIDTVVLNSRAWSHEWKNLPIYTIDGTKATYYVEEDLSEKPVVDEKYDTTYTLGSGTPTTTAAGAKTELDATASKQITIDNTHVPEVLSFDVTKYWDDNTNYYGLRDASIQLLLQYSVDGGQTWVDANASNSIVIENKKIADRPEGNADDGTKIFSASANEQTLTGNAKSNTWSKDEWKDLSAYVLVNGVSTKVQYRVVEKDHPGYVVTDSNAVTVDTEETASHVDIKNTLDKPSKVKVHKNWDLSEDILDTYKEVLPDSIEVQLQYSADNGQTWTNVPYYGTATLTENNNWSAEFSKGLRNNYKYRVVEVSMTWGDKTVEVKDPTGAVVYATEGEIGNFDYTSATTPTTEGGETTYQTELTNKLSTTYLSVVKNWKDEENRDNLRQGLVLNLYRDMPTDVAEEDKAAYLIATGVITTETQNVVTWENLPTYKNGSDTEPSVYTIEEILDGETVGTYTTTAPKTVSIDPSNGKGAIDISNIHYPNKGDITAIKYWEDYDNFYDEREEIYLTLMYRTSDEEAWAPVTKDELITDDPEIEGDLYDDGDVHTTSETTQKLEVEYDEEGKIVNVQSATWEDLPKVVNLDWDEDPTPVIYKVVETNEEGKKILQPGKYGNYTITYGSENGSVFTEDEEGNLEPITQDITNTYDVTELTVQKIWTGDEDEWAQLARPAKVTFYIEKATKVEEDEETGLYIDIWEPVNTPDGETVVDGYITVTEETGWAATITDLQLAGELFAYYRVSEAFIEYEDGTVAEVAVGDFLVGDDGSTMIRGRLTWTGTNNVGAYNGTVVTEELFDDEGSFIGWGAVAENVLPTGKLKVTKEWQDEDDLYERRPTKIKIQLYRDGKPYGDPVEIVENGKKWEYEWDNLPVFTDDPSDEDTKSVYYVEEEVPKDYHVAYITDAGEVKRAADATVELDYVAPEPSIEPEDPEVPEVPEVPILTATMDPEEPIVPEDPEEPEEPREAETVIITIRNTLDEDVKTGDGSNPALWVVTMLASLTLGTTAGLFSMRRKKRNK
ncbi:MAG: Cna B-type domain-containing protein [Lachnospiraceae bacterium]|nr:Cna B-type domain-containing protein [Lachnospiraceae bacterium]